MRISERKEDPLTYCYQEHNQTRQIFTTKSLTRIQVWTVRPNVTLSTEGRSNRPVQLIAQKLGANHCAP